MIYVILDSENKFYGIGSSLALAIRDASKKIDIENLPILTKNCKNQYGIHIKKFQMKGSL